MTSMPVMDKSFAVGNFLSGKTAKAKNDFDSGGFGQFMKQSETVGVQRAEAKAIKEAARTGERDDASCQNKAEAVRERMDCRDQSDVKSNKTNGKEKTPEEIREEQKRIAEAAEQMVVAIAQELGLTSEQVRQMSEQLGLTDAQLLTADGVKCVMIGLTDGADQMSLLTDATLYQSVDQVLKNLDLAIQELSQSLEMSSEEFQDYLQSFLQHATGENSTEEQILLSSVQVGKEIAEKISEQPISRTEENSIAHPTETADFSSTTSDMLKTDMQKQFGQEEPNHSFMQGGFESPLQQLQGISSETAFVQETFAMPDTQEIMDQIMDYMKIQVKPEMSHLEMQLHPESLGTLHIQISSREGVMTAQFTTQNMEVKAVLESQMMELKTNLEQQGIKVEAVEVTIAEYSLNQNLSRDTSGQEQQMGEQKKGRRTIRLEELNDQMEGLSPEEKMTAEIMQSEGTTVNYTV